MSVSTDLFHWSCVPGCQNSSRGVERSPDTCQTPSEERRQAGKYTNNVARYRFVYFRSFLSPCWCFDVKLHSDSVSRGTAKTHEFNKCALLPDLSSEQHGLLTSDSRCDLQDKVAQICLLLRDQKIKDLIGEAGWWERKVSKREVMC